MKVAVVGSGGWGTALALVLAGNGHSVSLWCRRPDKCAEMRRTRENPVLKGIVLPEELKLTDDMAVVGECGVVVLATPSFAVRETARRMRPHLAPGAVIVSVSKGIERETSLLMSQVVEEELGTQFPVVVLSGPSHAEEVGRGVPTAVVVASQHRQAAELVQDLFMNQRFRIYTSPDILGVEIGAAMKNIIAICAGWCAGMGFGDNTKAMLMTRGLTEMARLGLAMGARKETFAGLAGLGDLIVTCTSLHSRNCRAGMRIGQGSTVEEAVSDRDGTVVEGYYAAASVHELADKLGVEMPIAAGAYGVLYEGEDPRTVLTRLMSREKKGELETEDSWI